MAGESKMKYQAIILDIDGTLVSSRHKLPSSATLHAIAALQRAGVLVVIATGRSYFVADERTLGFRADYSVCTNGAYAVGRTGEHLYDERLTLDQTLRILQLCEKYDCPLGFAFSDANYVYRKYVWYSEKYSELVGELEYVLDGEDRTRHLRDLPYTAFAFVPDAQMREFCIQNPDLTATAYAPGMYDVFRSDLNKARGLQRLLDSLGVPRERVAAIGDGENDREMLEFAGCGIAMGNAPQSLKQIADRQTGTVDQDGAAAAINWLLSGN